MPADQIVRNVRHVRVKKMTTDTPPAPLAREAGEPLDPYEFGEGGCPALMQWFASEVGLSEDQIHVMLSNADYLATDIQPCEACARLKQHAGAMAGLDRAQIDAWALCGKQRHDRTDYS